MANLLYLMGKRILISKSRGSVREAVIFMFTHLLLIMGVVFAAEIALVLLGVSDIYVPIAGSIIRFVRDFSL